MLKKVTLILFVATIVLGSCKDTDHALNEATNERLRAELKDTYPSLNSAQIRIEVKDFRNVKILLGDKQLFAASDDSLQAVAEHIGQMVCDMYHENNYLNKGELTIVEVERRVATDDDPKKVFDLKLKEKLEKIE